MVASNNFYALMIIIELKSPLGEVYQVKPTMCS